MSEPADFILRHAGELVTLAPAAVAAAGAEALPEIGRAHV